MLGPKCRQKTPHHFGFSNKRVLNSKLRKQGVIYDSHKIVSIFLNIHPSLLSLGEHFLGVKKKNPSPTMLAVETVFPSPLQPSQAQEVVWGGRTPNSSSSQRKFKLHLKTGQQRAAAFPASLFLTRFQDQREQHT
jgi:hypothetical protein